MDFSEDIGQVIRRVCRAFPSTAYLFVPVIRLKDRLGTGFMHETLEQQLAAFPDLPDNASGLRRLKRDVWYCFIRYDCPISEYFLYRFDRLSHTGRNEYVTEGEKVDVCHRLTSESVRAILWDKWKTYERFRPFFRRDAIKADENTTTEEYRRFAGAHSRFIAKPLTESCGSGVVIYDTRVCGTEELPPELRTGFILEELIEQAEPMARFHPASVNTIRCATFLKEGEVHILFTFLRIGRSGSIVDNGGAGGFIAYVDTETGIIVTPGRTEAGLEAIIHPDTGAQILGVSIPRWEEMKALVREMALTMPEQPYISWDLALTEDGWVMVEGNSAGQFVGPQYTLRRGMRRELSAYFDLHE